MVASNVSDEAAAVASTTPKFITAAGAGSTNSKLLLLNSSVWADFEYNAGEGGAAATATCRWCDKTLCAGGRNGTSHLRRHSERYCPARADEERRRQPTAPAAEPSPGDQELLYIVDGLNIPQLFDELNTKGLVHIDPVSSDANFRPSLPQSANSSSRWFFQKTRERKRTGSKKRCVPDGFVSQDQLSARGDFSYKETKMLANYAVYGEAGAASGDYSCGTDK